MFGLLVFPWIFSGFSYTYDAWDKDPASLVDSLKDDDIQKTKLNNVNWTNIKETLTSIKSNSSGYIKWLGIIWLSAALLLIIYNWMLILANFGEEDKLSKAKKRFVSLILWVVLLVSAVVVIKLVTSLVWAIFS